MLKRYMLLLGISMLALSLVLPAAAADGDSMEVTFMEQNGSGMSGTATLVEQGGQTTVTVNLSGAPTDVEQPAHIHPGTCQNLDPKPQYPLNSVVNGQSQTTVDVTIDSLLASPHAINVHKSAEEVSVYVACADLVASGGAQMVPNTGGAADGGSVYLLVAGLGIVALGAGLFMYRRFV